MNFPWHKYEEIPLDMRNTVQVFITNKCNMSCDGCFVRDYKSGHMSFSEYTCIVDTAISKGAEQVNIIGGEPFLHPELADFIAYNKGRGIKTTVYTNGTLIDSDTISYIFDNSKVRISIYGFERCNKSLLSLKQFDHPVEFCFMVSYKTQGSFELLSCANYIEHKYNCNTFFISSIRELDNSTREFFRDTHITLPVIDYKYMVHDFLTEYEGNMDIHVSKRGVFESTITPAVNTCRFINCFSGGDVIQCPYDIVNKVYQKDYSFGQRYCRQNNTCLMSKIKLRRRQ